PSQPKSGLPDFGRSITPNSGKPEFGASACERWGGVRGGGLLNCELPRQSIQGHLRCCGVRRDSKSEAPDSLETAEIESLLSRWPGDRRDYAGLHPPRSPFFFGDMQSPRNMGPMVACRRK